MFMLSNFQKNKSSNSKCTNRNTIFNKKGQRSTYTATTASSPFVSQEKKMKNSKYRYCSSKNLLVPFNYAEDKFGHYKRLSTHY